MMEMETKTDFATWMIIALLVIYFLGFSLFAYLVVGNPGQPTWDLGIVKDVPAQSSYSMYKKLPYSQHVRGKKGE
jgi:hypothetical protein